MSLSQALNQFAQNLGRYPSGASLSRRVNANSQRLMMKSRKSSKLIKKGEC